MRFSAGTLSAMPKSSKKSLVFFVYLALALSTIAVFWQIRNFDFVNYDDDVYVYENPHVLNGLTVDGLMSAFTSAHAFGNWLPLTWLSFMLDCQLFGTNPGWMHLVNMLLHIANTLLLFAILKKMTGSLWPSAFVAALFALHPMHVESVAWITERKDVLSTLFLLLTLAAYVSYVRRRSLFSYLLAVLLFVFGLLAKPMLVTLPFLLLLLDYWPLERFVPQTIKISGRKSSPAPLSDRRRILYRIIAEKIPFFALSAVSSVITFIAQSGSDAIINTDTLPLQNRVANAFFSYATYIGKMFWPQKLAVFYPFDIGSFAYMKVALCAILLLVISIFVIGFRRKQKYLLFGWFWFIITLVPVIGLVQSGSQAYADRYTYVSYIGLFIMLAWGLPELLSKWRYRKIVLGVLMLIVLMVLGIGAHRQVSCWKNSTILFSHALEVTQNNYIAHCSIADELRKQNNIALAIEHYTRALQILPDNANALLGLGCVLGDQGDLNQAIEYFQKTLQLKTFSILTASAHNNLGIILQRQGKFTEAITHFTQAIRLEPDSAEFRNSFAEVLVLQGRLDEAIDQFRAAVKLRPGWFVPVKYLAWYIATHPEIKDRNVNEAISLADYACKLTNYKDPSIVGILAAAYASAGRFPEAIETAKRAIAIADAVNQPQIKNIIQNHLDLYAQGKPYIETPQKIEIRK